MSLIPIQTPFDQTRIIPTRWGHMIGLTCDPFQTGSLTMYGEWAREESEAICSCLNPGDTALDIGANIGTMAIPMSKKVGASGRVIAFEPQRVPYFCLCGNIALTHVLTQARALQFAVAESDGVAMVPVFNLNKPFNVGGVRLSDPEYDKAVPLPKEEVPQIAIDGLGLKRCDLIKIDVEAMESRVLRGAEQTIRQHRPIIFAEALEHGETRLEAVNNAATLEILRGLGYDCRNLTTRLYSPNNIRHCPDDIFPGGDRNIVAFPSERERPDWFNGLDPA